ncbi:MAG: prenyltransferase/squalene oxidase repeat-containing protein, partial [Myxococcota bacterium]
LRSDVVGLFRPGHTLTALAAVALADRPAPLARAVGFLAGAIHPSGALGWGPVPEYPTYATSLAVRAFCAAGRRDDARPLVGFLTAQQLVGDGWGDHPARGGFPMGSPEARVPPNPGHVDLSMTRHALEALRAWGLPDDHPAWAEAARFVDRCRTADGGFRYSPVEAPLNKGETPESGYGTPSADGVLATRALGRPVDLGFVVRSFRTDQNPGIGVPYGAYARAMRFYWRATAAAALRGQDQPAGWRDALRAAIVAEQQPDGSFVNELGQQKENEPIVATALAVLALRAAEG